MMKKNLAICLLTAPLFFVACKSKCVEDSGNHSTKEVSVKPYDEIEVSGPIKLIIRQDSTYKLVIEADSNVINLVKADVSGHELTLKLDADKYCGTDSIIISAGIGELKKLKASAAAKVYTSSKVNLNDISISLAGATVLNIDLNAGKLTLNNDGVSKINLSGQAGVNQLTSKGSLELNSFAFIAGVYNINVDGNVKANINVLNELNVKTTGAAEIYYKGNPKNVEQKKTGVLKLEKVN